MYQHPQPAGAAYRPMAPQPSSPMMLRVLWGAYGVVVAGAALYLAGAALGAESQPDWSGLGWTPPNYRPPLWAVALWSLGTLALVAVPWRPIAGLLVYTVMSYGVTRYNAEYEFMLHLGVIEWVCGLSFMGWMLWLLRQPDRPALLRRPITWIMGALVAWLALSSLVAVLQGRTWNPLVEHHPIMYLEGMILFAIAAHTLKESRDVCMLAAVLGIALSARATLSSQSIWRDGDIGAMLVIALPLTVLGALTVKHLYARIAFAVLSLNLLRLLIGTQNRAAAVAFVAAVAVVWLFSRRKLVWIAAAAPLGLVGVVVFMRSQFWGRFSDIWTGGSEKTSAFQRLEIWRGGWRMFTDHPLFGVGTGNFANEIQKYEPQLGSDFVAHNNYINILAEAGFVGLLLYVALFAAAMLLLLRVWMLLKTQWPATAACYVCSAIMAYLAVGMFITRPDMGFAYMLAGWSVALASWMDGPAPPATFTPPAAYGRQSVPAAYPPPARPAHQPWPQPRQPRP